VELNPARLAFLKIDLKLVNEVALKFFLELRIALLPPTDQRRPNLRAFFTNMRGPQPWFTKVHLLVRNNWLKISRGQNCCGHYGEPGC
jgi:hypothetical protein